MVVYVFNPSTRGWGGGGGKDSEVHGHPQQQRENSVAYVRLYFIEKERLTECRLEANTLEL